MRSWVRPFGPGCSTERRGLGRRLGVMSVSVTLPDDLAARLAEEARRRHVTTDELAATLLAKDLQAPPEVPDRPLLRSLIGMGASDGSRSAADIEDVMAAEGFGR
jgi:Ribbon-helix-helix protein, copG family